jgi:hypothetical protein
MFIASMVRTLTQKPGAPGLQPHRHGPSSA